MNTDLDRGDTRLIIDYALDAGVLRNQLAYILGTAFLETNYTMKPVEEGYYMAGKVSDLDAWRRRNKNISRYYPYYGRGYVQLTWDYNYTKAGAKVGADLLKNPALALDPKYAVPILVKGMMEGWFTGRKLPDYVTLNNSDFYQARRVVNSLDRAIAIATYAKNYDDALLDEGYGVTTPRVQPKPPVVSPATGDQPEHTEAVQELLAGLADLNDKMRKSIADLAAKITKD